MSALSPGGDQTPDSMLDDLADRLLDAAANGRFAGQLAGAVRDIEMRQNDLSADQLIRCRMLFFDLAQVSTTDRGMQAATAVDLLSALNADSWDAIAHTNRFEALRLLVEEPEIGLELAELLTYAPDHGIRDFAVSELEAIGIRSIAAGEDSRSIERLLHATGAGDAAYRLETARKRTAQLGLPLRTRRPSPYMRIPFRTVAIAGGHAQLRRSAMAVLERYGMTVVPIPSSSEAVRRERDILRMLQGCDLVMVLVRQITHSTSDQVRKAAERLGIPVRYSNAASATAIERELIDQGRTK